MADSEFWKQPFRKRSPALFWSLLGMWLTVIVLFAVVLLYSHSAKVQSDNVRKASCALAKYLKGAPPPPNYTEQQVENRAVLIISLNQLSEC